MTTPTTVSTTAADTSTDRTPRTWFYWVAFTASGGAVGAVEMSQGKPITRGDQLTALHDSLGQYLGRRVVGIISFSLLRVEDADGQVIG